MYIKYRAIFSRRSSSSDRARTDRTFGATWIGKWWRRGEERFPNVDDYVAHTAAGVIDQEVGFVREVRGWKGGVDDGGGGGGMVVRARGTARRG